MRWPFGNVLRLLAPVLLAPAVMLGTVIVPLPALASGGGGHGGGGGGAPAEDCKSQNITLVVPVLVNGKLSGTKVLDFLFCLKEGPAKDAFKDKKVRLIDALNIKFYGKITPEVSSEEIMTDAYELVISIMTPDIMKDVKFEMTHDQQNFQICEKKGQGPIPCPK